MQGDSLPNQGAEKSRPSGWFVRILYTPPFSGEAPLPQKDGVQRILSNLALEVNLSALWLDKSLFRIEEKSTLFFRV